MEYSKSVVLPHLCSLRLILIPGQSTILELHLPSHSVESITQRCHQCLPVGEWLEEGREESRVFDLREITEQQVGRQVSRLLGYQLELSHWSLGSWKDFRMGAPHIFQGQCTFSRGVEYREKDKDCVSGRGKGGVLHLAQSMCDQIFFLTFSQRTAYGRQWILRTEQNFLAITLEGKGRDRYSCSTVC